MRVCFAYSLLVLMVGPFGSRAETADPAKSNYLVFPAKKPAELTELQRIICPQGKDAPNCNVIINASAVVREDNSLDAKAIDWKRLGEEIRAMTGLRLQGERFRITITAAYYGRQPEEEGRQMLRWALIGLAQECDYDKIDVSASIADKADGWAEDIKMKKAYDLIGKKQDCFAPVEPGKSLRSG